MAGIEDVYERLINDPNFRRQLEADPAGAIAPFDLSEEDLAELARRFSRQADGVHQVEERTSKSALINLIGSLISVPDEMSSGEAVRLNPQPDPPGVEGVEDPQSSDHGHSTSVGYFQMMEHIAEGEDLDLAAGSDEGAFGRGVDIGTIDGELVRPSLAEAELSTETDNDFQVDS